MGWLAGLSLQLEEEKKCTLYMHENDLSIKRNSVCYLFLFLAFLPRIENGLKSKRETEQ